MLTGAFIEKVLFNFFLNCQREATFYDNTVLQKTGIKTYRKNLHWVFCNIWISNPCLVRCLYQKDENYLIHKGSLACIQIVSQEELAFARAEQSVHTYSACHEKTAITILHYRIKDTSTCSGLWKISMNGYSVLCRVMQNPGYFGHSTYKTPEQETKTWKQ